MSFGSWDIIFFVTSGFRESEAVSVGHNSETFWLLFGRFISYNIKIYTRWFTWKTLKVFITNRCIKFAKYHFVKVHLTYGYFVIFLNNNMIFFSVLASCNYFDKLLIDKSLYLTGIGFCTWRIVKFRQYFKYVSMFTSKNSDLLINSTISLTMFIKWLLLYFAKLNITTMKSEKCKTAKYCH